MIKISVIIPSYCPDDYIFECLDSVCQQSFDIHEYEILVIVNGCNEPYVTKINDYLLSKGYKNYIRVLQTDKAGVSNARNMGIDYSKGEYLVFVDDDDVISHNYLFELYKVSDKNTIGCSNSYSFNESIENIERNFLTEGYDKCAGKEYKPFLYRHFLSPPVCKLIHRGIIGNTRFPLNLRRSEDSVFCMCLVRNIKSMVLAPSNCIYYIRKRQGSASRNKRPIYKDIQELLVIELSYIKIWIRHPFSYNIKFILSRLVAAILNFRIYRRQNK